MTAARPTSAPTPTDWPTPQQRVDIPIAFHLPPDLFPWSEFAEPLRPLVCNRLTAPAPAVTPALLSRVVERLGRMRPDPSRRRWEKAAAELARTAEAWRAPASPLRQAALRWIPLSSGFSPEIVGAGIDATMSLFAHPLRVRNVLLEAAGPAARRRGCPDLLRTPSLVFVVLAGAVPHPAATTMAAAALLGANLLVKSASVEPMFPALFASSLSTGAAVLPWPGGSREIEDVALRSADLVVAYGSDDAVAAVRARTPGGTRFIGHPHRFSIGVVTRNADLVAAAEAAATDVCLYDLLGCLSPAAFFVQDRAAEFAEHLAVALERKTMELPPGERTPADRIAVRRSREKAEFAALGGRGVMLLNSDDLRWTIAAFDRPDRTIAPLERVVNVIRIRTVDEAAEFLGPAARKLSTVGTATPEARPPAKLVRQLADLGARRICPLGTMQTPPLLWRHDGRFELADFVERIDVES